MKKERIDKLLHEPSRLAIMTALAGCAAMDIVLILARQRQDLREAERRARRRERSDPDSRRVRIQR